MAPNIKSHQSYYQIDTASGLPIKVVMRFQINMVLNKKVIPLIWQEILVDIDSKMKLQLYIVHFLIYYLPVVESLLIVVLSLILYKSFRSYIMKFKVDSVEFNKM